MVLDLGAFSLSLAVKDIHASYDFYQKLGFDMIAGDIDEKWLILQHQQHVIGLFEGMLERNVLTFNPGWDQQGQRLPAFNDIRQIQAHLLRQGLHLLHPVDLHSHGPASCMLEDPDGNPILIDQHI